MPSSKKYLAEQTAAAWFRWQSFIWMHRYIPVNSEEQRSPACQKVINDPGFHTPGATIHRKTFKGQWQVQWNTMGHKSTDTDKMQEA